MSDRILVKTTSKMFNERLYFQCEYCSALLISVTAAFKHHRDAHMNDVETQCDTLEVVIDSIMPNESLNDNNTVEQDVEELSLTEPPVLAEETNQDEHLTTVEDTECVSSVERTENVPKQEVKQRREKHECVCFVSHKNASCLGIQLSVRRGLLFAGAQ